MRAAESQRRWANFQQALAYGAAAGAMTAAQQPVYQPVAYQPPPAVDVRSAFGRTTTYQPDGVGGMVGSDGTVVRPDGLGGVTVTTY